jgi:hypothetical protein
MLRRVGVVFGVGKASFMPSRDVQNFIHSHASSLRFDVRMMA